LFIINFKNYDSISGSRSLELAKIAAKISRKYKIKIVVCPPQHVISEITKVSIPVFAQHVDNKVIGSTTGYIIPELVKKSGVSGSLVNHSEHRLASKDIKELVSRLKALKMRSVVCVKNVSEARKYAKLNPDYIAIEPPELIGTGKAVSRAWCNWGFSSKWHSQSQKLGKSNRRIFHGFCQEKKSLIVVI